MSTVAFDSDDVGKPVVNENDEEIGIVVEIRRGTAYVDPEPGTFEKIKTKLGWESSEEESYPLQDEQVAVITDDQIQLGAL